MDTIIAFYLVLTLRELALGKTVNLENRQTNQALMGIYFRCYFDLFLRRIKF